MNVDRLYEFALNVWLGLKVQIKSNMNAKVKAKIRLR